MSTLLQRLAGQAIGARAPRVRAAERVRAQVPIVMPAAATPRMSEDGVTDRVVPASPPDRLDRHPTGDRAPRALDLGLPAFGARERGAPHLVLSAAVMSEVTHPSLPVATAPVPLLGEVAQAVPVTAVVGSIQPSIPVALTAAAGGSPAPAEVHVHIGRVEVMAMHPAAPPARKREATPRRSAPLSDYLARRRSS